MPVHVGDVLRREATWVDGLGRQEILGDATLRGSGLRGSGLRVVEVTHAGNTNASPEEAAEVARLVRGLVGREWQDKDGARRAIGADEVLVVTPYNAQIRAIEDALAQAGCSAGVRAVVVASNDLIRVACRTPRQMYLANALCRAWESGESDFSAIRKGAVPAIKM